MLPFCEVGETVEQNQMYTNSLEGRNLQISSVDLRTYKSGESGRRQRQKFERIDRIRHQDSEKKVSA